MKNRNLICHLNGIYRPFLYCRTSQILLSHATNTYSLPVNYQKVIKIGIAATLENGKKKQSSIIYSQKQCYNILRLKSNKNLNEKDDAACSTQTKESHDRFYSYLVLIASLGQN